jgi:hypothetical protein
MQLPLHKHRLQGDNNRVPEVLNGSRSKGSSEPLMLLYPLVLFPTLRVNQTLLMFNLEVLQKTGSS